MFQQKWSPISAVKGSQGKNSPWKNVRLQFPNPVVEGRGTWPVKGDQGGEPTARDSCYRVPFFLAFHPHHRHRFLSRQWPLRLHLQQPQHASVRETGCDHPGAVASPQLWQRGEEGAYPTRRGSLRLRETGCETSGCPVCLVSQKKWTLLLGNLCVVWSISDLQSDPVWPLRGYFF